MPSPKNKVHEPDPADDVAEAQPPWWRPIRPGRRRQPLTRRAIIDAAIKVLDAEGVDALTVRRLADELNTGSATLYWHISSKDELGEIIYDHVMGEVELPEPDPSRWQEQLKDLARQTYRIMLGHRDLVRFSLGRVPVGPNMLRIMEWSLDLLRKAGISDQSAAYAGDMLGRYLDASVLEAASQQGPEPQVIGEYFAGLSPASFPNIVALSTAMFTGSDEERFEFGLDLLVRGLEAHRIAAPAPRRRRVGRGHAR